MRILKMLLAAAGMSLLLAACGTAAGGTGGDATGCSPKGSTPNATAAQIVKIIPDPNTVGAFTPKQVTVSVGQAVEWDWQDPNVQHTTTSDDNVTWDSCLQSQGAKFIVSFSKAGTYTYHCTIHPLMVGTVVVR